MLIDENIKVLEQNTRHWFGAVEDSENMYPKFLISEKNDIEYFQNINGNVLALEDKYDETIKINPLKKEVIFIFGINSIKEIKEISRKKHKDSIMLIIEPKASFFQHALVHKNLAFLKKENIFIFADQTKENIIEFLEKLILDINLIGFFKNMVIYLNSYYRNYDFELSKSIIILIQQYIQSATIAIGNDVDDSIQGLNQNMENLKYLPKAKNPYYLKGKFHNKPAVMVAAGPSLNKNIHYLKKYQNNVVIIAVDTILERLLREDITPHFVCSVERLEIVYDYFYKNKDIPKEITLVGPLLLNENIFKTFQGEYIIPFRTEVTEFRWLQNILDIQEDVSMPVGLSCAHMAFGVAQHLGCSPIIMIGQDLAYDAKTGSTHATGTTYGDTTAKANNSESEFVTGYYDDQVLTTKIWNTFRHWFESQILNHDLFVINATEGGAKINHTHQLPLQKALNKFAHDKLENVYTAIKQTNSYDIDINIAVEKIKKELVYIADLKERCKMYFQLLQDMNINSETFVKKKLEFNTDLKKVHILIKEIFNHQLIMHNTQPLIVTFLWEYNSVEEILSVENLKQKRGIVARFIGALTVAINKVERSLESNII